MDDIILRVKDICKYYPGVKALDGVNFEVKRGEVHAICGENGAGKSTFIKILTGANEPTSGTIEFNGKEFAKLTPKQSMELSIHPDSPFHPIFHDATCRFPMRYVPVDDLVENPCP